MGSNSSKGLWQEEFKWPKRPKHLEKRVREIWKARQKQMKYGLIIPPGSPAETVAKQAGDYFVLPFTYEMCDWTDGRWPIEGSFAPNKITLSNEMVRLEKGNPDWDYLYMRQCAAKWEEIARKHKPPKTKPKPSSASSSKSRAGSRDAKLSSLVEKVAVCVSAASLPQLETALQSRSSEKQKIVDQFPDQVEEQAAALIRLWLDSQNHPTAEALLTQLKRGGLNFEWLLCEEESLGAGFNPQPPVGGADGHQQPAVTPRDKTEERKEREGEKEEENLPVVPSKITGAIAERQSHHRETESNVEVLWTPAELMNWLQNAPDPFIKPKDFHKWLRIICVVYNPCPVGVKMLLKLVYSSEWQNVQKHFYVPGADGNADWPSTDAMTTWLDNACLTSINKGAWEKSDFIAVTCCYQKPNELVTDFLQRFQQVWESSVGVSMEYHVQFAIWALVNCLQPHIADLFKLKCIDWCTFTLAQVTNSLADMERRGMFASKSRALRLARELQGSTPEQLQLQEQPSFSRPRRVKRGDRCFYCGRFGHWARHCRARTQQHARTQPDTSTWMCTYRG